MFVESTLWEAKWMQVLTNCRVLQEKTQPPEVYQYCMVCVAHDLTKKKVRKSCFFYKFLLDSGVIDNLRNP